MRYCVFLFGFIFAVSVQSLTAQQVKVVNKTTSEPVSNVYIVNSEKNKMVSTDAQGAASLEKFSPDDTLSFQHPAFKHLVLTYLQIQERDFKIKLAERSVIMSDIFVSASKRRQSSEEIPQHISQISHEQVLFSNPQTSADLLQSSGEVFVQKSQMGGGSPMIRGFAANSVLLTVDGIRMNNAIFRSGNLQNVISIDVNAIENTEVLFGPGSIIYGSDALGGVMNFQTKQPSLSFAEDTSLIEVNGMTRYSSANNERTIHADADFGFEKWGMLTSVTYSDFDDLRAGGNFYDRFPDFGKRTEYVIRRNGEDTVVENEDVTVQRFSGYQQLNVMQKFRYKPNNEWEASYGFHYATSSDIPRYDRLIQRENGDTGPLVNAEWYYGPQIWMMNKLDVEHFSEADFFDKVTATFTHQWFQESRNDRDFQDVELRNREENVDVYMANLDFDKMWGNDKELYYGLEGIYNYVNSEAYTKNIETGAQTPAATRYPDEGSDYWQLAGYARYQQDLSSRVTAVAGARYSHILLDARFSSDFYNFPFDEIELNTGALSGSLGFIYQPAENLQLNVNGSTGFRAPNVDDVAKVFDSEPGTVVVPNANLDSEHSYNLDFTVIKDFGDVARLEINSYYTWLRDALVRRDFQFNGRDSILYDGTMSKVEAVVNAGRAYIYGASAGFSAEFGSGFIFDSHLTITEGKDQSNDEPLRHVAPLFGKVSLAYQSEKIKVEAYTEFNDKKDISDFSPSERSKTHLYTPEGSPSWATLNLKTSYQLSDELQINAGIENIFDKHYRPYSSGISAAGRNVTVAIRANL